MEMALPGPPMPHLPPGHPMMPPMLPGMMPPEMMMMMQDDGHRPAKRRRLKGLDANSHSLFFSPSALPKALRSSCVASTSV